MKTLQDVKDLYKSIEVIFILSILILGCYLEQINSDWVIIILIGYTLINFIRIGTEPNWKTKNRIKKEIDNLKIFIIKEEA